MDRDPLIGAVLGGRYRITGVISAGGVGAVYRAEQVTLIRRAVAIKLLRPSLCTEPTRIARFEHEARITAKLRHPNTVRVLDSGRMEDGRLYFVTELLEGSPLDALIARGPIPAPRLIRIARQIAASLREAHEYGVVHRDLKPGNVFLEIIGGQEIVKVLDFGMAKIVSFPGLTMPRMLCGTPGYMAPEHILGLKIDQRADIYALGVIMYHALSGAPPFDAPNPMDLLAKHVDGTVQPLWSQAGLELDPRLEAFVHAMLAKSPDRRPPTMAAVDRELEAIEHALAAPPQIPGFAEDEPTLRETTPPPEAFEAPGFLAS